MLSHRVSVCLTLEETTTLFFQGFRLLFHRRASEQDGISAPPPAVPFLRGPHQGDF